MLQLVLHAAHQHALAEVLELRTDAELAPGVREAAVGGDQQARLQHLAVLQDQLDFVFARLDRAHLGVAQQVHVAACTDGLIGGAANGLVGHQVAEPFGAGLFGADLQGEQRRAVEHLGIAQHGDILGGQPRPQPETVEQCLRAMGEGDLAAVESGVGQGLLGLTLQQHDRQTVPGQGPGQAQAGWAGADDDDIG